jgi:hypothetical protein
MRSMEPSRVHGEPQPASRVYKSRQGAESHRAREQAHSARTGEDYVWTVEPVEGGWAVFVTDQTPERTWCPRCMSPVTHTSTYEGQGEHRPIRIVDRIECTDCDWHLDNSRDALPGEAL